eukprot:CAMPEP_0167780318 /NCGR_PEP_ID=MMETSP0111_2-20121227/5287_1 /TAXON_ID=91324 /ORGANISM="Lotharella globosa, Strain CCCM811" /LENGTH=360 /DNA_ID=CAMNT_0007670809 /DNA_START=858 /DNA_END=1939 /DNA_ORIENTATION=+
MILGKDTSIIPKNPVGRFDGFHICGHLFPEAPIPGGPRWLNSGAFVGYADAILDILDLTQELPSWFIDGYPGTDQGFFTQVYLSGKFGMKLDVCNDVFTAFAVHEAESENQIHSLWHLYARGPHRRQWNVLRAERSPEGDSLKSPLGKQAHGMKSEYLSIKHGPCSIVRRMEATMFVGSGVGKSWPHGLDFREGDCNYNWEEMARRCAVANDTLELMLDKEKSGLGFWLEFSPVRTFTDLGPEEHRALAMASFAAGSVISPEKWERLVEGSSRHIPGRYESLVRFGLMEAEDFIATRIDGLKVYGDQISWPFALGIIVLQVVCLVVLCWTFLRPQWNKKGGSGQNWLLKRIRFSRQKEHP